MKNKIILAILILSLCLSGCGLKEDPIFDDSPDERIAKALEEYSNMLTSAPHGWFLAVDTQVEGCFRHWVTFDKNNRTTMLSDLDATWRVASYWGNVTTSVTPKESSYRFRVTQLPSLIFDTYNYLHILSDPQGLDNEYRPGNGGANADGLKSDYDFYIVGVNGGNMELKGRNYGGAAILEPASFEDAQLANKGGLKTVHEKFTAFVSATYSFPTADIDGKKAWVNLASRNSGLRYETPAGTVSATTTSYLDFNSLKTSDPTSSVIFMRPMEFNGKTFVKAVYKEGKYWLVADDQAMFEVYDAAFPAIPLSFGPLGSYKTLRINNVDLAGTMKEPFLTSVYMAAYNNLKNNGGGRLMQYVELTFIRNSLNIPMVRVQIPYLSGTTTYIASWWYKYELSEDGKYITFTDRDQGGSSNEEGRERYLKDVLNYFCHVPYTTENTGSYGTWVKNTAGIIPKKFAIGWVKNETTGSIELIGGLTPVEPAGNETNICVGVLKQ